jgi:hypothetical protein
LRTRKSKIDQENSNDENAEESEKTSPVKVKKRRKKKREKKARKILESSDEEEEEEPVPEPFQNLDSDTTSQSSNNPYNNMSKLTSTNYHNATTSTPAQVHIQSGHMTKNDLKSHFRSFPRHQIVYQASVLNLSELQLLQKDAESTIKVLATSASITTSTRILKVK